MGWWGRLWSLCYLGRAPWDIGGPRPELVCLVESGELPPCRAIDLGCGIGENVIYLARHGFDAAGVDISPRAIARARRKAGAARVSPAFLVSDVTNLTDVDGPFDLVVDNGCLHSLLSSKARQGYVQTLLRLTRPGSGYFLRCFVRNHLRSPLRAFIEPGEIESRFGGEFDITTLQALPPGLGSLRPVALDAVYLMRRKGGDNLQK
ncbi:MAG: methyltransferase domain-containing protein [Chloroflexi bacterium]|nr:methyltransferase domain-containing protein [Chloroflexota bacterium]